MMTLKEQVLAYIKETDYVTFAELQRRFPEFRDGDFSLSARENHILWVNMTEDAVNAITQLREEGLIVATPSQMLTYLIDGMTLTFPLAKGARAYKKPHWAPVVWRPSERISGQTRRIVNRARHDAGLTPLPGVERPSTGTTRR